MNISANQVIAGGQAVQRQISVKPVREAASTRAPRSETVETPPADDTTAAAATRRPGRAHIQQDVHHLARNVRRDLKAELKEMKAAGTWTPERAKAVRELGGEFLAELHQAVKAAGRGHDFDAGAVPEGVRQAMISLTEKLAAFNGPRDIDSDPDTDEGGDGTVRELPAVTPDPDPPSDQGLLVDVRA